MKFFHTGSEFSKKTIIDILRQHLHKTYVFQFQRVSLIANTSTESLTHAHQHNQPFPSRTTNIFPIQGNMTEHWQHYLNNR